LLYRGDGNDWLGGGNGNDVLLGGNGHDELYGMNGNDPLYGGDGDDTIRSGLGHDGLDGGTGDDKFVFADGDGHDKIFGFVAGSQSDDAMDLSYHSEANGFGDIAATQVGADSITLLGVRAGDLHTDDFIF
jgi:Ca2+-binding RTX toxin-like protein